MAAGITAGRVGFDPDGTGNLSDLRSRVLTEACQKEVQRQIEETADGEGMKGTKVKVVFQSEETEGIRKVTISGGYEDLQQKEAGAGADFTETLGNLSDQQR